MIEFVSRVLQQLSTMLRTAQIYYGGLWYYAAGNGTKLAYDKDLSADSTFAPLRVTKQDSDAERLFKQNARIHLYSVASHFYLWSKPHYRKGSFQNDLKDNIRNLAIPRTGVPLSIFAWNQVTAVPFLVVLYPLIALIAALQHKWTASAKSDDVDVAEEFRIRLLAPNDWFNHW